MSEKQTPEIWTLQFRAEGNGPPVAVRVRRLLKAALRQYGLRLVGYGDVPAESITVSGGGVGQVIVNTGSGVGHRIGGSHG